MDAGLSAPVVHFTVLFRLRVRARSLTIPCGQHDELDTRGGPSPSLPCTPWTSRARPSLNGTLAAVAKEEHRPSLLRATVHPDRDMTSPLRTSPYARERRSRAVSAPSLRPPFAVAATIVNNGMETEDVEGGVIGPEHGPREPFNSRGPSSSASTPLSTLDKRELSKVVLRDAVYAQLLDVVPSRRHVQTAVWALSDTMLQFGGAIAARPMFRGSDGMPRGTSGGVTDDSEEAVYARVQLRVRDMITDPTFFASVLKPYLGAWACVGDVELAQVDGVTI